MSTRSESQASSGRTLSIGEVLSLLKRDFPDVTISKIRFLETEGLITPARTSSGYRRFAGDDVTRLRDILTLQRDQYLPLKVIREQLDRSADDAPAAAGSGMRPEDFRPGAGRVRLTRGELADMAELTEAYVAELETLGLVWVSPAGHYDQDAVIICQLASRLQQFGFEGRHMRSFRVLADRVSGLIEQMATPFARTTGRERDSKARAQEAVQEIAALFVQLHAALLRAELIRSGKA
ncbi:MAG: MerR family transcriptional regulator [Candidatus Nanopelagicales bacterium]